MSEFQEPTYQGQAGTPRWITLAIIVLAGVSLLGLGVGWSAISHSNSVQQTTLQKSDELAQRLAKSEEVNQQLQSDIRVVTDKLNVTQADLVSARKQTKAVSAQYNQKLTG